MTVGGRSSPAGAPLAGLKRRLLSLLYEALLLTALLLAATLPLVLLTRGWDHFAARFTLQAWLLLVCGAFYTWQWRDAGQTLPMKTWRMRLLTVEGTPLTTQRALARYAAAVLGTALAGAGFLWAVVDREHQFLHDRIAGTRLVLLAKP